MTSISALIFCTGILVSFGLQAAPTTKDAKSDKKNALAASSQTEHSFEDLLVQGQYHFSDESVTTVEEDKVLDALIGVRSEFKDRLENSAEKN